MHVWYIDDTEVRHAETVYVLAGYMVEQSALQDLQAAISQVKVSFHLQADDPIKWNLRDDSLRKHYDRCGRPQTLAGLLQKSDSVRLALLQALVRFDPVILAFAVRRLIPTTQNSDCHRWSFENMLQRIGLIAEERSASQHMATSTMVIADWPQGGLGKGLFDIYSAGYYRGRALDSGQEYFSGPLASHRFMDGLCHGSTLHSGPLQVADLVTGCTKDFMTWCYDGRRTDRVARFFPAISPYFRRRGGAVDGAGMRLNDRSVRLDAKIAEISAVAQEVCAADLPF